MTKELFVSSTPHETKVGLVEDDQLAEVYLERENEYTLAGSIYKGRVTRVLPGMQSAFVDIGLERDAFLYVSDFMELENQDDDLDNVPATAFVPENRPIEFGLDGTQEEEIEGENGAVALSELPGETRAKANSADQREDRGGYRGRRRRRGSRREPNGSEPKYSRPAEALPRPVRE